MDLPDFIAQVTGFPTLSNPDKIKVLGWFAHVHGRKDRFTSSDIASSLRTLNYPVPALARDLERLANRNPPELLRDSHGYRLDARVRGTLDSRYGQAQSSLAVSELLAQLPSQVPGIDQRAFLAEVIACYRARAFRACLVMTWNLAFDHLLHWLLADPRRLSQFNGRIPTRYPKKVGLTITTFDSFEELKESETLEICNSATLITSGVYKVLLKELGRRNSAAHPSSVVFTQYQAEDCITDVVNNIVLCLQ